MNGGRQMVGPVGFFDSGVGGLSVERVFMRLCPSAEVYYVADWAYCPYGEKPESVILDRAHQLTRRLLDRGCRVIVVACNTATAVAIDVLRATYDVPFVGMEPAVKPAALHSKTGVVGILATPNTFNGRLFKTTVARFGAGIRMVTAAGVGFVELVESGQAESEAAERAVRAVLAPLLSEPIDHLVLGCTHYPFLKTVIARVAGPGVTVVDPSEAVARQALAVLETVRPVQTDQSYW